MRKVIAYIGGFNLLPRDRRCGGNEVLVATKYFSTPYVVAASLHPAEKETDVAIAIELVADAFLNRFDRALIISAASDFGPAIKIVNAHFPQRGRERHCAAWPQSPRAT
jgi:hypothetical protein